MGPSPAPNSSFGHRSVPLQEVAYLPSFQFEKDFNLDGWRQWFDKNWTISLYASLIYIIAIFGIQKYLEQKPSFKLTIPLATWNIILSVFSIFVFLRTIPEMIVTLSGKNGFHNSVCHWTQHNHATAYWSFLMLLSKLIELGDTLFIVMRKQKLIFLHWYHHITTLSSWWLMYSFYEPNQLWYIVMNSFVHSIMYFYYFLKAIKVRVPRSCAMAITSIQLAQMIGGISVNLYAFYVMVFLDKPQLCDRSIFGLKVSFWMYSSFLILFAMFFYDSYLRRQIQTGKSKLIEESDQGKPLKVDQPSEGQLHSKFD